MRFDVKDAVLAAGLAAITAIAFAPVVDYPFIGLDDYGYVADNVRVQAGPTLDNLAWAWSAFERPTGTRSPGGRTWSTGASTAMTPAGIT